MNEQYASRSSFGRVLVAAAMLLLGPAAAFAQTPNTPQTLESAIDQLKKDFDAIKQQYGDRLTALEAKLASAQGTARPVIAPPSVAAAPSQTPAAAARAASQGESAAPVLGASVGNAKMFNPDMAVIGDFLGALGTNKVQPD